RFEAPPNDVCFVLDDHRQADFLSGIIHEIYPGSRHPNAHPLSGQSFSASMSRSQNTPFNIGMRICP
ncbi:hypothetical protein, partial [Serratia liquefaciens]|uniref:hypothetical protein n=1 Tax=Serratia liquefaciens TaxID=614 RepID=UPI00235F0943